MIKIVVTHALILAPYFENADMCHLSQGYASPCIHSTLFSEAPHERISL